MKTYLSPFKPWEKLKISRKSYLSTKPWKKSGMSREKYEAVMMELPQTLIDEIRIEKEAEVLLENMFGVVYDQ